MFEFEKTNLQIDRDLGLLPLDACRIAAILDPQCDLLAKFGIEGLIPAELTFSVIVCVDRSFLSCQYTLWGNEGEERYRYEPSEKERNFLWELLEEYSRNNYGCDLKTFPAWFRENALAMYGVVNQ